MKTYTSPERKLKKVMVEKRRRMRIDRALLQMKHMVLESLNVQPEKYAKMEKADILDLTVRFLKKIRQERMCQGMMPHQAQQAAHMGAPPHPFVPTAIHPMAGMSAHPIPGIVPGQYYPSAFKTADMPASLKMERAHAAAAAASAATGAATTDPRSMYAVPPHGMVAPRLPGMHPYSYPRACASTATSASSSSRRSHTSHTQARCTSPIVISRDNSPSPVLPLSSPPLTSPAFRSSTVTSTMTSQPSTSHSVTSPLAISVPEDMVSPSTSRGQLEMEDPLAFIKVEIDDEDDDEDDADVITEDDDREEGDEEEEVEEEEEEEEEEHDNAPEVEAQPAEEGADDVWRPW